MTTVSAPLVPDRTNNQLSRPALELTQVSAGYIVPFDRVFFPEPLIIIQAHDL